MELEALVETPRAGERLWRIEAGRLDLAPLMAAIVERRLAGREAAELFHGALIGGARRMDRRGRGGARADAQSRSAAAA